MGPAMYRGSHPASVPGKTRMNRPARSQIGMAV
jgi:hypothetical protein